MGQGERALSSADKDLIRLLRQRVSVNAPDSLEDMLADEELELKTLLRSEDEAIPAEKLLPILREIVSLRRALHRKVTVSYLGPQASFTHQASHARFGSSAVLEPSDSISSVFRDVEAGRSDFGVVPVENSTEGAVTYTLDMLVNSRVRIAAEVNLRVSHCLLSSSDLNDIGLVYSHPQVFGQCREWLSEKLPQAELREVKSTAEAAHRASKDGAAAIASRMAAEMYRLPILRESIEDNPNNSTRFLVLSRSHPRPTGDDKTSICFALRDRSGALYDALHPFKETGINLTMIQSRPSKVRNWDYVFFMDMMGHIEDAPVAGALKRLEEGCVFMRFLGSYPRNDVIQ